MVTLKLCGNCCFWQKNGTSHLGSCSSEKFLRGYHHEDKDVPFDGVLVENDEGWAFVTGPTFACIHFIEREKKDQ